MIATFNRKDALSECLRTLSVQDLPSAEYELVVVVDGSTDGTAEMLRSICSPARLVVIEQRNKGQAVARNAGVEASGGELILFLDDDIVCGPDLISAHCAAHRGVDPVVVSGEIQPVRGVRPGPAEQSFHEELAGYYGKLKVRGSPVWPDNAWVGPNCSLPRRLFLETGGFDAVSFPRRWEDVDLGIRLWKRGIRFRFAPGAVVRHRFVKQRQQASRDTEEDGASMVRLCRKHPDMRTESVIFNAMGAAPWKRCCLRILSSRWLVRFPIPGAVAGILRILDRSESARRFCGRFFALQRLILILAGARRETGSWQRLRRLYHQSMPVLLYHHIGVPNELMKEHSLSISPAKFRRQIRWLKFRGYRAITSAQWLKWCATGEPLPNKPVLLSFDDAYRDLGEKALPMLERYAFPALVFAITELSKKGERWEGSPVMSFDDIRHWASRNIEFGGHTRTHADLAAISAEAAIEEVCGCRSDLSHAGVEAVSFAYPFGSVNEQARRTVEGVFALAFTCEEGLNDLRTDSLLLKRTMVQPGDTLLDLEFRVRFGRNPLDRCRSRLRIRSRLTGLSRQMLPRT